MGGQTDRCGGGGKRKCVLGAQGKGTLLDEWTGDRANGKRDGQTNEHSLTKSHCRSETSGFAEAAGEAQVRFLRLGEYGGQTRDELILHFPLIIQLYPASGWRTPE